MAINRVILGNIKGLPGGQGAPGGAGRNGLEGRKINFRGAWVAGSSYSFNNEVVDVVSVGGDYYFCRKTNSRTASPALDTAFWGKMRGGSLRYIENFTLAVSDWEAAGTAYVARKASGLPSGKFLQEIIDADVKETYGIFFDKIDGGDAVFYARNLPAVAVSVSLWYYDLESATIEAIEVPQDVRIGLVINEDNGRRVSLKYSHSGLIDWGDGTVDDRSAHDYSDGSYIFRMRGDIGDDQGQYNRGMFGARGDYNHNIKSVVFETPTLRSMGFAYCDELESATLHKDQIVIPNYAFYDTKLRGIELPAGCVEIGAYAFANTAITAIDVPNGVTAIGSGAFMGAPLRSFSFPLNVTIIESETFNGCRYCDVFYLPNGITEINNYAFANCKEDATIDYNGTKAEWRAIWKADRWGGGGAGWRGYIKCTDGYEQTI